MHYLSRIKFVVGPKNWLLCFNIAKCKHLKYDTNTSPYEYYMDDDGGLILSLALYHQKKIGSLDNIQTWLVDVSC